MRNRQSPGARLKTVALALVLLIGSACHAADKNNGTGKSMRDCPECPELVVIPAGSFTMGSTPAETTRAGVPDARALNEQPAVKVTIGRSFAIGRYELTVGEFRAFATATGFKATAGCFGFKDKSWALFPQATWEAPGHPVTDRHPAMCLNSSEYRQYLAWLSRKTGATYRLPTEAEWEHAARLGTPAGQAPQAGDAWACKEFNAADRQFTVNFDDKWPAFACDDGYLLTAPVGTYAANGLGMYDVLGNVSEITADCFVGGHKGRPADGSARRVEPKPCSPLVFKGGSWAGEPSFLRPAFRVAATAEVRGNGFGMRVVRELP
jgi:formylglycine-generating enzyme required for sulfatase activity